MRQDFGDEVKKLMKQAGFRRQKELAEAAGVDQGQLSKFLSGEKVPTVKRLEALAKALDVPPTHFYGEGDIVPKACAGLFVSQTTLDQYAGLEESIRMAERGDTELFVKTLRVLLDRWGNDIGERSGGVLKVGELPKDLKPYKMLSLQPHDPVWILSLNGTIIWINEIAAGVHGYERSELLGRNVALLYRDPNDRIKFMRQLFKNLHGEYQSYLIDKEGQVYIHDFEYTVMMDNQNTPHAIKAVTRQIVTEAGETRYPLTEKKKERS